jgi:hypothetical protein
MDREYSEDNLKEQTSIDLFFHELGWMSQFHIIKPVNNV